MPAKEAPEDEGKHQTQTNLQKSQNTPSNKQKSKHQLMIWLWRESWEHGVPTSFMLPHTWPPTSLLPETLPVPR